MPATVSVRWNGDEVSRRFHRAVGRGTIGIAERISREAKQFVHVITGTLRRSIHVARTGTSGNVGANWQNVMRRDGAVVEVGSWITYACVEEVGRGHRYMQPALERGRSYAVQIMRRAFKEEGF